MSFKRNSEIDMDQVASFLKDAVNKVKTEENADLLNDLKKVYKQNVPFTLRMYVAAYLVKEVQSRQDSRFSRRNDRPDRNGTPRDRHDTVHGKFEDRPARDVKPQKEIHSTAAAPADTHTEDRTPRPRVQIDESLAATIFISIGRNRRVYPRDLVGLLISVAGLDRDRIGDIRVLANYSFVQLFKDDTEKAITALNGYDYRGRKLVVSYSRQKGDEEPDDAADSPVPAGESAAPNTVAPAAAEVDPQTAAEDAKAYAAAERAAANKEPFTDPAHVSEEGTAPASDKGNGFLV